VALVCLLAAGASAGAAPPAAARPKTAVPAPSPVAARYAEARRSLAAANAGFQRALVESLDSDNPYERHLALGTLAQLPALVEGSVVPAVARRLEELTPLQPEMCVGLIERLDRSYGGQGEEHMYANCLHRGGTSNGSLAAKLLAGAGRSAFPVIVAQVAARPKSAEAVLASLGPAGVGPAADVAGPLAATKDPEVQRALLRLALAGPCGGAAADTLAPVAALQGSASPAVSRLATLAVLRLTGCGPADARLAEARNPAIASVGARLQSAGDAEVVSQVALLGPAAEPFVPLLVARFDRATTPQERTAILAALAAAGAGARAATPLLAGLLRGGGQGYLVEPALRALAAIGPPAVAAKPAVLALAADADSLYTLDAAETLARIGAKLDAREYARLYGPYAKDCQRAGSIPFFNLGRDDDCARLADAVHRLGRLGGHRFKEVGWRR